MGPEALQLRGKGFSNSGHTKVLNVQLRKPLRGSNMALRYPTAVEKKRFKLPYGKNTISKIIRQKAEWEK